MGLDYEQLVVLCLSEELVVVSVGERGDGAVAQPVEDVPEVLAVPVDEHRTLHPLSQATARLQLRKKDGEH